MSFLGMLLRDRRAPALAIVAGPGTAHQRWSSAWCSPAPQTARRTATAFPRFEAAHGYDTFFYSTDPGAPMSLPARCCVDHGREHRRQRAPDLRRAGR